MVKYTHEEVTNIYKQRGYELVSEYINVKHILQPTIKLIELFHEKSKNTEYTDCYLELNYYKVLLVQFV